VKQYDGLVIKKELITSHHVSMINIGLYSYPSPSILIGIQVFLSLSLIIFDIYCSPLLLQSKQAAHKNKKYFHWNLQKNTGIKSRKSIEDFFDFFTLP